MNPEKEILNWWLHKRGFFTMNSIRVARNKEIDTFAIRLEDGNLKEAIHIESLVSISPGEHMPIGHHQAKFDDPAVVQKMVELIERFVGAKAPYRKLLIVGQGKAPQVKDVEIESFENVLREVLLHLDRQNYRNNIVRTLQLVKYIQLANPEALAGLVQDKGNQKILKQASRERFIRELFTNGEARRILGKEGNERLLITLLQESTLKQPERLADALLTKVLTPRTRRRFIAVLLEHRESKDIAKQLVKPKGEKSLQSFLR